MAFNQGARSIVPIGEFDSRFGALPLSSQLKKFMQENESFYHSMRFHNPKYVPLNCIFISTSPIIPSDEVLGVWYFNREGRGTCGDAYFKQDYIVNLRKEHQRYVSYTNVRQPNAHVQPIAEFFKRYGDGEKYFCHVDGRSQFWNHRYATLDELPNSQRLAAQASACMKDPVAYLLSLCKVT